MCHTFLPLCMPCNFLLKKWMFESYNLEIRSSPLPRVCCCFLRAAVICLFSDFSKLFLPRIFHSCEVSIHWSLHSVIPEVSLWPDRDKKKEKNTLLLSEIGSDLGHSCLWYKALPSDLPMIQAYCPLKAFPSLCLALGMCVALWIPQYMGQPSKALIFPYIFFLSLFFPSLFGLSVACPTQYPLSQVAWVVYLHKVSTNATWEATLELRFPKEEKQRNTSVLVLRETPDRSKNTNTIFWEHGPYCPLWHQQAVPECRLLSPGPLPSWEWGMVRQVSKECHNAFLPKFSSLFLH